jgi:hypothetical protein
MKITDHTMDNEVVKIRLDSNERADGWMRAGEDEDNGQNKEKVTSSLTYPSILILTE